MNPSRIKKPKIDIILALAIVALIGFGLIMLSSASTVISYETFGQNNYFLYRQLVFFAMGLVGLIVVQGINYHWWKRYAKILLIISVILTFLTLIPGLGLSHGGASRWLNIGFFDFQPSELLKLAVIVYLATWFDDMRQEISSTKKIFIPFCVILGVIGLILLKQPDMGTFMAIAGVSVAMYFVAGARPVHLGVMGGAGIALVIVLIKAAPYRMARLLAFLDPEKDPLGVGFHINQALIAVGSGGFWGRGFGKSGQKYTGYIPEAPGDSIFAIIAEELGFVKVVAIPIALFVLFAWRGYMVARSASDFFGKLLAFGITSWIVLQAMLNIATMTSLMPLTGIPLPFISYGGSSMIMTMVAAGLLLNISKHRSQ